MPQTRRQERDQSKTIHPVPIALRGISNQPEHLRLPGQMTAAQNAQITPIDGASKRSGTEWCTSITLNGGSNMRSERLVVAADEKYKIVFGKQTGSSTMTVRIYRVGTWAAASVTIATAAQTYLDTATADQLRFVPISKDETLIISNQVVASTSPAPTYTIAASWRDYGVMVAQTPTDGTYHRALADDEDEAKPHGFYKYDVGGVTFATVRFAAVSGREAATPVGIFDNTANSPQGFSIRCRKYDIAFTNGTWDGATTLTKTGAFANYSFTTGDQIRLEATGGLVAGWYTITARLDADRVTLLTSPGGATGSAQVIYGISVEFDVQRTNNGVALADMYAVAESFQDAFRAAGADNGLVSWTRTGASSGYFTITSPFRGAGATIYSVTAPSTGTDLSTVTDGRNQFYFTNATVTAGTGSGSLELDIASRWTEVSPSGSADGSIDNTKFPVTLLRTGGNAFRIDLTTLHPRESGDGTTNPSPGIFQKSGSIIAVSASNPATITSLAHARKTGDVLTFTGLTTGNGTYTITVTDADSFTIPTAASGTGTWTQGGAVITDAIVHRGRLGLFGGPYSSFSAAKEYRRFYLDDYRNIVDSDPIDAPIGAREVVDVEFVVDWNGRLVAFSRGSRQYEFGQPEALTPSTASWTGRTRYSTYSIRPQLMDAYLYFLGPRTNKSVAWEMRYDGIQLQFNVGEISAHVRDLLPMSLRSMVVGVNENVLIVLPTGNGSTSTLYVYRAFWDGPQKEQSEWVTYVFDPGVRLVDLCVIDGDVYMLTETTGLITSITAGADPVVTTAVAHGHVTNDTVYLSETQSIPSIDGARVITRLTDTTFKIQTPPTVTTAASSSAGVGRWSNTDYMIEKLSLSKEDPKTGYPYTIHLDRRLELTGVYAAPNTTFTLPFPAQGSTINRAVLKTSGTVVDLSGATFNGSTIVIAGDYSATPAYLGRYFDFQLQLTRPFFRDNNGIPDLMVGILLNKITLAYRNSGDFSVRLDYDDARADVTSTFTPTATTESGIFMAWTRGDCEHATVYIESSSPKQLTIGGYQQEGDYAFGLR